MYHDAWCLALFPPGLISRYHAKLLHAREEYELQKDAFTSDMFVEDPAVASGR